MLVFEEEGEDDHDADTAVDDGSDGFPHAESNLISKEHHQEEDYDDWAMIMGVSIHFFTTSKCFLISTPTQKKMYNRHFSIPK